MRVLPPSANCDRAPDRLAARAALPVCKKIFARIDGGNAFANEPPPKLHTRAARTRSIPAGSLCIDPKYQVTAHYLAHFRWPKIV
jgi:hypothetical protein